MKTKYSATIIGSAIGVICLATTQTFIVPLVTILPFGLPLELIFGKVFENSNYVATATSVFLTLLMFFLAIGLWYLRRINKERKERKDFNNIRLLVFFAVQLVIIHPLVFYMWAAMNSENAGDGQFMLGVIETFPVSSIMFVVVGHGIDLIKNKKILAHKK